MNRSLTKALLSFLLLFSVLSTALPQMAFAQAAQQTAADYSKQLQAIEDKVVARQKELGIPGISLAIIKDGQIIYLKGLGYKDLENKIAVTPDTQFAIGSATKAFTALTVLMSQDEGKLSIDDSPKKYLPYFKMYDPETDKNIQIRDLLCHASGLNRTDLAMITGKLNRNELIQVAAQSKPTAKLREKFQYQNIMFTAAGEIAAQVQKQPFDTLIENRIFKPLGMTNSTMSMKQMEKAKDFSFGYSYNFDTKDTEKLPFRDIDEVAPAGSINSSARDMAQWVRFVLNGGTVDGKRLVSEKSYDEWLKPQQKIAGTASYGFGWFLQNWNGLKVVQHGGNIDGFNSMVAMIPEKKLGFVLLTNVSASPLGNELMPIVWQNLLGDNKPDDEKLSTKTMEKMVGKYRLEVAKIDMEVKIVDDQLVLIAPGQPQYFLQRTAPRQFVLLGAPAGFAVKFSPEQGEATSMYLQQPQGNYTLPRVYADGTLAKIETPNSGAAKELVGKYKTPKGGTIEIKQETSGSFTLNIEGQQPYTLGDKAKDSYSLSPLPESYWLTAKRDADGKLTSVVVTQPEGEFEFKRSDEKVEMPKITVDELAAKTIEAVGGEANWRKHTSSITQFEIDFESQGVKATSTLWAKAPNKTAAETIFTALNKTIATEWEYFDGSNGEDMISFAPIEKYTGKRLEDIRINADFYAPLDWKTNFQKITITGFAKVGDEDAIVVTFEPDKGTKVTDYYSAKTFLLLRRDGMVTTSTSDMKIPYTIMYSDYREVDGVKIPFKTANNNIANGNIVTTIKSVKYNVPIDDTIFAPRPKSVPPTSAGGQLQQPARK